MSVYTVEAPLLQSRLDQFLVQKETEHSRAVLKQWIENGHITLNGNPICKAGTKIKVGDIIEVTPPPPPEPFKLKAEAFDFPILFEDEFLLVIHKPAGIVVHPAHGHTEGTLVNALLSHVPELQSTVEDDTDMVHARPGIVHRLDKDTSGCLIVAKTAQMQARLSAMFAEHTIHKEYLALTQRLPSPRNGTIENHMGRHPTQRQKMAIVTRGGRRAVTHYDTLLSGHYEATPCALVRVNIETGRTHQIRVHLASVNAPIAGDAVYGGKLIIPAERQMLHARQITFMHPMTHKNLKIVAPVPDDMLAVMALVGIPLPTEFECN